MSKLNYPNRIFSLSDCHGGQFPWDPFRSPDVAARLSEAIRSDLPGLQHFDTYGRSKDYHDHIVRETLRLHQEAPKSDTTGLFINSAPRTEINVNGDPFYRAEFDENVCIVATPLSAFSAVRDSIKRLLVLPNERNGLYDGEKEQHRSSYAPRLLAENHGLDLVEVDIGSIPELSEGCALTYVDRFGNLVLYENGVQEAQSIRAKMIDNLGEELKFKIGRYTAKVQVAGSLSEATPGELVVYVNDNSVEVLRKWKSEWGSERRFDSSAYSGFGKPGVGEPCKLDLRL